MYLPNLDIDSKKLRKISWSGSVRPSGYSEHSGRQILRLDSSYGHAGKLHKYRSFLTCPTYSLRILHDV